METQEPLRPWDAFQTANRFRRAIRSFNSTLVPEEDILALLREAMLAPSSGNLQPYQLHWIREPALKASVARACNGQKAAATATDLIVVAASPDLGKQTAQAQLAHIETSPNLLPNSKAYYRKQTGKFLKILGIGSAAAWSVPLFFAALFRPALSLLPVGHIGSRHWAARNAIFAAQTLILGAAAKGIDTCPMEGFSASQIARLLKLPRGTVIPLVIALGYRADDTRVEDRWRRPTDEAVISYLS